MSESNNNVPMRITQLEEATAYEDGMYNVVAKAGGGTKKILASITPPSTLYMATSEAVRNENLSGYLYRTLTDGEFKYTFSGAITWNYDSLDYWTIELNNNNISYVYFGELKNSSVRQIVLLNNGEITYLTSTQIKSQTSGVYARGIYIKPLGNNSFRFEKYNNAGNTTQIFISLLKANIDNFTSYVRIEKKIAPKWLYEHKTSKSVFVAASDATDIEKEYADIVCLGTNDQEAIIQAINEISDTRSGTVFLSSGNFYIDDFTNYYQDFYAAIYCVAPQSQTNQWEFEIKIQGVSEFGAHPTTIKVTNTFLEKIENAQNVSVFGGYGYGSGLNISDLVIDFASNQYPIIAYNGQALGHGEVKNVMALFAANNSSTQETIPNENCIGFRSFFGDDNGIKSIWESVVAIGAYVGFQLGAEHMILKECSTRFCFYGYTFGDYSVAFGNAFIHPITLINCCDEHSARLPKFVKCGAMVGEQTVEHPLQEVTMISFNIERWTGAWAAYAKCAEEVNTGDFCGRIEYTLNGYASGGSGEASSAVSNHVSAKFWENGSGLNFTTINMAHRKGGTSALRRLYYPNYMQQYYDTDINKLLICKDPENKTWVDSSGTIVQ